VSNSAEELVESFPEDVAHHSWMNIVDSTQFHISSVRALAVCVTSSSVLIFSAGGRGQLCAWEAEVPIGRLRWLAEYRHRVIGRRRKSTANHNELSDIRYMKVTVFGASDLDPDLPDDLFILSVACSDGYFRSVSPSGD